MKLELFFILAVMWVFAYSLGNEVMRLLLKILFILALWGTLIYIAFHFITKYW